jgi:dipeptidyl aminopeptidase/acylaminoacyl peptidase
MRRVPIDSRAVRTTLAIALLIVSTGCGKDDPAKPPPPPPRLTSPRIAFTRGVDGIHLYDPATGTTVGLSRGFADEEPAISPDGRRIAFVNSSGGMSRLMTMAVNGTDRLPVLTNAQLSPGDPHWSPDSRKIVFTGTTLPSGAYNVYTILATGDSLQPLTSDGLSRAFAWSPDGSRILYAHHEPAPIDSVCDMLPSGLGVRPIFRTSNLVGADYSPDGAKIILTFSNAVTIADADGSNANGQSMPDISEIEQPSWSPDGSWIVLSAHPVGGGTYDLFLTTPTPADTVQLLLGGTGNDEDPDWGPRP